MKIALCTELRNAEWFESRLRSLFAGDGQLVIDELWNEKQLSQALRRSRYHAVVIAMTGARGLEAAIQAKQLTSESFCQGGAWIFFILLTQILSLLLPE